jgi:uncharacterized membrane protein YhaH (DUF805 family)
MGWQEYFFHFDGRIGRLRYWLFIPVAAALMLVTYVLASLAGSIGGPILAIIVEILGAVIFVTSSFAVTVKRLHDRGKSAWWLLVFYALPVVISVSWTIISHGVQSTMSLKPLVPGSQDPIGLVLSLVSDAIGLWALVELGFLRGTAGPNRYGPDPLQAAAS